MPSPRRRIRILTEQERMEMQDRSWAREVLRDRARFDAIRARAKAGDVGACEDLVYLNEQYAAGHMDAADETGRLVHVTETAKYVWKELRAASATNTASAA